MSTKGTKKNSTDYRGFLKMWSQIYNSLKKCINTKLNYYREAVAQFLIDTLAISLLNSHPFEPKGKPTEVSWTLMQ